MKSLIDINIEKSRSGVYKDTSENRRLHRVGQRYGSPEKEEDPASKPLGTKDSDIADLKRDKREAEEALKKLRKNESLYAAYQGGDEKYNRAVQSLQNKIDTLGQEITRRNAEGKKPSKVKIDEDSKKQGGEKFSRVNLPDIPNAHKVNLTKYLSSKRKKAVDDAWNKAKFDSLTREKAGVFQEGYNKLREQFNNNFDDMSKSERAELLYKILKMKNAMEKRSASETKVAQNKVSSVVDERLNVTPLSDPGKYSENARNSVEKKNLVEILRSVGKPVKEEETETGTYGIYKVGNSYIQVVGSDVTTGLKRETSKNRRLGMPGHKRWYGGGESFNKTDKSETFSVYDSEKMNLLIEKLKEGK